MFLRSYNVSGIRVVMLGVAALATACSPTPTAASTADEPTDSELTIVSILDNPIDGASVTLQGYISKSGDDPTDFTLTNGAEEIPIEIYDESFIADPDVLVSIIGEVDLESEDSAQTEADPEDVEIDVSQIEILNP